MNITLKELIERTTPGPLVVSSNLRHSKVTNGRATIADCPCTAFVSKGLGSMNARRLAHSYNVLPEVVAILEDALSEIPADARLPLTTLLRDKIQSALEKSNTIAP